MKRPCSQQAQGEPSLSLNGGDLPQRVYIPFIDSMQRLQAQELPVIQAKGLELEHFHLSVSSHQNIEVPLLRLGEGLMQVEGLAALACPGPCHGGPTHMAQPWPASSYSTRLQYKEQHTQKPAARSHGSPKQSRTAAVSRGWCIPGDPLGIFGAN